MNWDKYFSSIMYLIAMKSKDEKTQNGAIIVGPDNEIISTGYNSFPRGINDNLHERQERPEKYFWFEHAERNAIYNAARIGVSLKNCKIYVTGIPCMDCARGIVQSGINEIVIHDLSYNSNLWEEHSKRTLILFEEAKINIRFYKGDIINKIFIRKDGKEIYL
jgi:dCMP deaminase